MLRVRRLTGQRDYIVVLGSYLHTAYYYRKFIVLLLLIMMLISVGVISHEYQRYQVIAHGDNLPIATIENILNTHPLDKAKQKITALNSVHRVIIHRGLSTTKAEVYANIPKYTLVADDTTYFVNADGEIFTGEFIVSDYVRIDAPKEQLFDAISAFETYQKLFEAHKHIQIHTYIADPVETFIVNDGAKIIIGNTQQIPRLERMLAYTHIIKFRPNSIIDLRYKNGFAKTN